MCTLTPLLFPITHKLLFWETFKCLACLLFFNNIFWVKDLEMKAIQNFLFLAQSSHTLTAAPLHHHYPPLHSFYVTSFSSSSFCSSITLSILIKSKPLDVRMMLVCISACLALLTPLRLAGPPAVPGSMLRMQGMAQWMISRKFPAVDWTKCPKATGGKDIHLG